MGHDTRRELKVIPAQVKIVEHKRAVYSCRSCEKHSVYDIVENIRIEDTFRQWVENERINYEIIVY